MPEDITASSLVTRTSAGITCLIILATILARKFF